MSSLVGELLPGEEATFGEATASNLATSGWFISIRNGTMGYYQINSNPISVAYTVSRRELK